MKLKMSFNTWKIQAEYLNARALEPSHVLFFQLGLVVPYSPLALKALGPHLHGYYTLLK